MRTPTPDELHYAEMLVTAAQTQLEDERERWTTAREEVFKTRYLYEGAKNVQRFIRKRTNVDDDCQKKVDALCDGLALDEVKARTAYRAVDAAVLAAYNTLCERRKERDAIQNRLKEHEEHEAHERAAEIVHVADQQDARDKEEAP